MAITRENIEHVIKLAHLTIDEADKDTFCKQIQDTIEYIDILNEYDVSSIDPTSYANLDHALEREDTVVKQDLDLEKNAPQWEDQAFRVPKINAQG